MRLANDYLEQARHLATRERTRPKQASLRRAVSVAYYALFHLLSDEASKTLVRGLRDSDDLQARTARTLDHGAMARACRAFSAGALPPALRFLLPLDADLRLVAERFAEAQESRHRADYNLQANFNRTDTLNFLDQIEEAFDAYTRVQNSDAATYFLFALFFYKSDRFRD